MNVNEQPALAEKLRRHFLSFPELPVSGGAFSLDGLNPEGESMALQMNPGQTVQTYLDGCRVIRQPFTINHRRSAAFGNSDRSAMIGGLNALGGWLRGAPEPDLGPGARPRLLEQSTLASIIEQTATHLTYSAGYVLEYETD